MPPPMTRIPTPIFRIVFLFISIFLRRMILTVTGQEAPAVKYAQVFKDLPACDRIGSNDRHVEVDQVAVVYP